jgi:hypothetical protein
MPLSAVQAFAHSAVVTDENFFSHAKLVSTWADDICQALFSKVIPEGNRPASKKNPVPTAKKLACRNANPKMPIEIRNLQVLIMNVMIAAKRIVFTLLTVTGLAFVALGASQQGPCPLPVDSSTTSAISENAPSPEKDQCMRVVMHNGMPICLPCPAADAHVRVHGDADLGPCDKPGNQK